MDYKAGFIFGIIITIVIIAALCVFIFKVSNTDGKRKTEYDERQKLIIGEGYKIAFWTLAGLLVLVQIIETIIVNIGGGLKFSASFGIIAFAMIIISIMVFCVYCIFNGAYWGLNNNKKRYIIIIGVIGVLNLLLAFVSIIRGEMIVDGVISGSFVNLLCAILMAVVIGAVGIKELKDKRENSEDEGEE